MFELFFIVMLQDLTIREQWPDSYASQVDCMDDGWSKADEHKQTIVERYPDLQGFDIECMESENTIQSHVSLIIEMPSAPYLHTSQRGTEVHVGKIE